MTPPKGSAEGDLLRHAIRSLIAHVPGTPRYVTRHLLDLAVAYDARMDTAAPRAVLAGRWVRRTTGNGGPGIPGIGHIADATTTALDDGVAVCGKKLRGVLDWGTPARPGNHADGWRPCRTCVSAIAAVTSLRRTA